jgi:hypothetical protein
MSLPAQPSLGGILGSAFDLPCVIIGIDFGQRLRQLEVDVVEANLPLLDPASYLDALVAVLPFLGFRIECLLRRQPGGSSTASDPNTRPQRRSRSTHPSPLSSVRENGRRRPCPRFVMHSNGRPLGIRFAVNDRRGASLCYRDSIALVAWHLQGPLNKLSFGCFLAGSQALHLCCEPFRLCCRLGIIDPGHPMSHRGCPHT